MAEMDEHTKMYSPSAWSIRFPQPIVIPEHCRITLAASEEARKELHCEVVCYDDEGKRLMDVMTNDDTPSDSPILVFIHGGYWQAMGKEYYTYVGIPVVKAGGTYISMGYTLAPLATVSEIVEEIKTAVKYIATKLTSSNGTPRRVYLCGHSGGCQLAIQSLANTEDADIRRTVHGLFLFGGVYDLRPLVDIPDNDALKLTTDVAWSISPDNEENMTRFETLCNHLKIFIFFAEYDTPAYMAQSRNYGRKLIEREKFGKDAVKIIDVKGVDHFDMVERLIDPRDVVTQLILETMQLNKQ